VSNSYSPLLAGEVAHENKSNANITDHSALNVERRGNRSFFNNTKQGIYFLKAKTYQKEEKSSILHLNP
jgi:hypothetical protein